MAFLTGPLCSNDPECVICSEIVEQDPLTCSVCSWIAHAVRCGGAFRFCRERFCQRCFDNHRCVRCAFSLDERDIQIDGFDGEQLNKEEINNFAKKKKSQEDAHTRRQGILMDLQGEIEQNSRRAWKSRYGGCRL